MPPVDMQVQLPSEFELKVHAPTEATSPDQSFNFSMYVPDNDKSGQY